MCTMNIATTITVVRCPYCVSDDEFRQMIARLGDRFVCNKCGHSSIPSDKDFKCSCRGCFQLRELDLRRCG
jgi:predicted RNA-binding Zn-ribbon protein involved in translation (DUF1610 family)